MTASAAEISCRELVELVTEYLDGALSRADRRRFERHISACEGCAAYLDQMRQTIAAIGHLDERTIDPVAREELMSAFRTWRRERVPASG